MIVPTCDGNRLAIAGRFSDRTMVSVTDRRTMATLFNVGAGARGEIGTVQWLDDGRLLVGADRADRLHATSFADNTLHIVSSDGKDDCQLPANFISMIIMVVTPP